MNASDIKAELEKRERELEAELAEVRRMLGKAGVVAEPYPAWRGIVPPPWAPPHIDPIMTPIVTCELDGDAFLSAMIASGIEPQINCCGALPTLGVTVYRQ